MISAARTAHRAASSVSRIGSGELRTSEGYMFANIGVTFYDRRLACPQSGTPEAAGSGIVLEHSEWQLQWQPAALRRRQLLHQYQHQFYRADLTPIGHNIRLSAHNWDPELNSAHWRNAFSMGGFIGDYFGIQLGSSLAYVTSVSTYNDGTNQLFRQQQTVAMVAVPHEERLGQASCPGSRWVGRLLN